MSKRRVLRSYRQARREWLAQATLPLARRGGERTHYPDCPLILSAVSAGDEMIAWLEGKRLDEPRSNVPHPVRVDGAHPTCRHCLGRIRVDVSTLDPFGDVQDRANPGTAERESGV